MKIQFYLPLKVMRMQEDVGGEHYPRSCLGRALADEVTTTDVNVMAEKVTDCRLRLLCSDTPAGIFVNG